MRVYAFCPANSNASFYYRIFVPLETMEEMGLKIEPMIDTAEAPPAARMAGMAYSDLNLWYQPAGSAGVQVVKQLRDFNPAWSRSEGMWRWPPSHIVDTDDNLFNVHPMNPAFKSLGIRAADGADLKDGDTIKVLDQNGNAITLWEDGKNGFNVAANKARLDGFKEMLGLADLVTCSTPGAAAYLKEETGVDAYIFPNCVRFDHYPQPELREHPNEVRILWQASPTHYEDIYPLRDAIARVAAKYNHVKWLFWGANYPYIMDAVPQEKREYIAWVQYAEYRARLALLNHDIALAPLVENKFSSVRSAIKWYEASVLSNPVATLAANTGAYKAEIEPDVTGLLYDSPEDFETKLCELIEDRTKRLTLAANAKDWLRDNRDAFKVVPKLYEKYMEVREKFKEARPAPEKPEDAEYEIVAEAVGDD